jgi:hypothetical protein
MNRTGISVAGGDSSQSCRSIGTIRVDNDSLFSRLGCGFWFIRKFVEAGFETLQAGGYTCLGHNLLKLPRPPSQACSTLSRVNASCEGRRDTCRLVWIHLYSFSKSWVAYCGQPYTIKAKIWLPNRPLSGSHDCSWAAREGSWPRHVMVLSNDWR